MASGPSIDDFKMVVINGVVQILKTSYPQALTSPEICERLQSLDGNQEALPPGTSELIEKLLVEEMMGVLRCTLTEPRKWLMYPIICWMTYENHFLALYLTMSPDTEFDAVEYLSGIEPWANQMGVTDLNTIKCMAVDPAVEANWQAYLAAAKPQ